MSPELRKELFRAVNQLAASTDCAPQRTLSNFLLTLQDNRLREALEYYSLRGSARAAAGCRERRTSELTSSRCLSLNT
jgi:hypothetical protein